MSKLGLHREAPWKFSVLEIHGQGFSILGWAVFWQSHLVSEEGDQIPALKFQIHYKKDSSFNVLTLYPSVQYPTVLKALQGNLGQNLLAGKLVVQLIVGPSFRVCDHISGCRAV